MLDQKHLINLHEKNKRYLESLDLNYGPRGSVRIIDRDGDKLLVELSESRNDIITTYRYIRVKDSSTGKDHFLSVPNRMNNCCEAVAWTFGLTTKQYILLFET